MSLSNLRVNVIFPARFHIRGLRTNLLQTGQDVRVYEVVLMGGWVKDNATYIRPSRFSCLVKVLMLDAWLWYASRGAAGL